MRTPTSKENVAEQGIVIPNWSKISQTFKSHSSGLALEKQPKNVNFQSFLPLIDCLVATFNETRAPTSRKHVAEQGIEMPNGSKTFPTFWSHSSVFFL